MSVKISKLEIENVKRVRAVKMEPSKDGLTIIGGDNGQGKTSVLDSIAWALGGDKFRPSQPGREGSVTAPYLHIVLSNGLVVERKGKNSDLKVTDPSGQKAGQHSTAYNRQETASCHGFAIVHGFILVVQVNSPGTRRRPRRAGS